MLDIRTRRLAPARCNDRTQRFSHHRTAAVYAASPAGTRDRQQRAATELEPKWLQNETNTVVTKGYFFLLSYDNAVKSSQ